jgi:hypothetical protein
MPPSRVLLAALAGGVVSVVTSWLLVGVIFHRFQARPPATWRPVEGGAQYAMSSGLTILAALLIASAFSLTGAVALGHGSWIVAGLAFGALVWGALAVPIILDVALYVNLHRGFVVGLLLNWLVVCLICATAAAAAMR